MKYFLLIEAALNAYAPLGNSYNYIKYWVTGRALTARQWRTGELTIYEDTIFGIDNMLVWVIACAVIYLVLNPKVAFRQCSSLFR